MVLSKIINVIISKVTNVIISKIISVIISKITNVILSKVRAMKRIYQVTSSMPVAQWENAKIYS